MEEDYKKKLEAIIPEAKRLAAKYYMVTGRSLGVTGEVAEYEAAEKLGLDLADPRTPGYDATRTIDGEEMRIQIKGRCIVTKNPGQRIGSFAHEEEWDSAILVILGQDMEPIVMYEAPKLQFLRN